MGKTTKSLNLWSKCIRLILSIVFSFFFPSCVLTFLVLRRFMLKTYLTIISAIYFLNHFLWDRSSRTFINNATHSSVTKIYIDSFEQKKSISTLFFPEPLTTSGSHNNQRTQTWSPSSWRILSNNTSHSYIQQFFHTPCSFWQNTF